MRSTATPTRTMLRARLALASVFALGVVAVCSGALWQWSGAGTEASAPSTPRSVAAPGRAEVRETALEVLHGWDVRRSRAWAAGDPQDLAALYVRGSEAGERDVEALASYRDRGWTLRELTTQVLAAQVRRFDSRRLVVVVTDRLAGGVAVRPGLRQSLPRDRATRSLVQMVRRDGQWLVAEVSPMPVR